MSNAFDHSRGFGFVEVPTLKDSVFLHTTVLEKSGFYDVHEGDELVCDVIRNEKGFVVAEIQELAKVDRPVLKGHVIKTFDERGYGFVYMPQTGADAFLHFNLLSQKQKNDLYEGQELLVEVTTDGQGRSQVRRVLDKPMITDERNLGGFIVE